MPCAAPTVVIGGVTLSTNTFENAQKLIKEIGSDQSDPTADEYEGYIANGNNTTGATGIQQTLPTQTTLPTPSPIPATESITTPPPVISTTGVTCTIWDGINYDVALSPHFKLRNFTVGYPAAIDNETYGCMFPHPLIAMPGYAIQTRFCNLQALALGVLEPLYAQFGQFRINSGIRNENSVAPPKVSQHVTGEAVDVQFIGWTYDTYWQNAAWIKDNIPYDQFIFEHSEKTKSVWLHLSYSQTANRAVTNPTKVMTMYRGHYDSGLKKYY